MRRYSALSYHLGCLYPVSESEMMESCLRFWSNFLIAHLESLLLPINETTHFFPLQDLLIYLKSDYSQRMKSSNCWFIPQMDATARVKSGQTHEPGAASDTSTWMAGAQTIEPFSTASHAIRSGTPRTQTSIHMWWQHNRWQEKWEPCVTVTLKKHE